MCSAESVSYCSSWKADNRLNYMNRTTFWVEAPSSPLHIVNVFDTDDGDSAFLRNTDMLLPHYSE
jgi:hypothetical protein